MAEFKLPLPDTHCFDDDTQKDVWSYSTDLVQEILRAALDQPMKQLDGLPMVIAGALFDFAGFLTTREKLIVVGSTADAAPIADLVKEWAGLRELSLDDAAVWSWQEWVNPQQQPAVPPGYKLLKNSTHAERSWPEDASHENGSYHCTCVNCGREFVGYKRRVVCRVCDAMLNAAPEATAAQKEQP